jgi:hypothetical protein
MLSALIAPFLFLGGFELSGQVGAAFPASGLEQTHRYNIALGAGVSYAMGSSRLLLDYGYCGLPSNVLSPYRLDIHDLSLGWGLEFLRHNGWGFEGSVAAGYSLSRRTMVNATESGTTPVAHAAMGLYQGQGSSRFTIGLDNSLFFESVPDGATRTVSVTWIPSLKLGVGYVF